MDYILQAKVIAVTMHIKLSFKQPTCHHLQVVKLKNIGCFVEIALWPGWESYDKFMLH